MSTVDGNTPQGIPPSSEMTPPPRQAGEGGLIEGLKQFMGGIGDQMQKRTEELLAEMQVKIQSGQFGGLSGAEQDQLQKSLGKLEANLSVPSTPNVLPLPVEIMVSEGIEQMTGMTPYGSPAPIERLSAGLQTDLLVGGAGRSEGAARSGNQPMALALLGGLVMASLFENISAFTKVQSQIEKAAAENRLKLQELSLAASKEEAALVLEKAQIEATKMLINGAVGFAAASISFAGGVIGLSKGDAVARIISSTGDMMKSVGEGVVGYISALAEGEKEAAIILVRAFKEILAKAENSMDEASRNAHDMLDKAMDLLRNFSSATMNLVRSLTGH